MMKKVFLIVMILLGCGAVMQAKAQSVPYYYDSIGVGACSGSVVTLSAPHATSFLVRNSIYRWYWNDTISSNEDTSHQSSISFQFNGADMVVWSQRTDYNRIPAVVSVTWTIFYIHKEIIELSDTRVACGSYVWYKPSGDTTVLTNSGDYQDTVLTTCTKQIYTLHLTIPTGLDTTITTPWCHPNHIWRGVTFGDFDSIRGNRGHLFVHDSMGCPVTDTIIVTNPVHEEFYGIVNEVACDSFVWSVDGLTYTSSEVTAPKRTGLLTSLGCDSMQVLNLTIDTTKHRYDTVERCDSYKWLDSNTYVNSTNTPIYTIVDTNSICDTVAHLILTINRSTTSEETQRACDSYTWHDSTYTASDTIRFVTTNADGCDSTIWLNLEVNYTGIGETKRDTACDSYYWDGEQYSFKEELDIIRDTHIHKYATDKGCDSIFYLELRLGRNTYDTLDTAACVRCFWRGREYLSSGVYQDYGPNPTGCKDYYQLNLTINHVQEYGEPMTVCGSEYIWDKTQDKYYESGTYKGDIDYVNCTQAVLYLTLLGIETPPETDLVVKDLDGYDDCKMLIYPRKSSDTLDYFYQWQSNGQDIPGATRQYFKFQPSKYRGQLITVAVSGIEFGKLDMCYSVSGPYLVPYLGPIKVVAQPNPNRGRFTVTLTEEDDPVAEAVLYNAYGTKVATVRASAGVAHFDEALQPGMYLVVVTTQSGKTYTDKVVVDY